VLAVLSRTFDILSYLAPSLFLIATAYIVVNTLIATPRRALAGLGLVAVGLPVYFYYALRLPPAKPEDWLVDEEQVDL
jgi:APA family basic amino acid/polyamine antiporter